MFMNFLLGLLLGVTVATTLRKQSKGLTPAQFADAIALRDYDYLLDVRTPGEWKQGHHPAAKLMPIGTFVTDLPATIKNKNARILLYCKRGIRAEAATQIAHRLGYDNVRYLDGTYDELSRLK